MISRAPVPKWLIFLAALSVMTLPAPAQSGGQLIIFSSPQSDEGQTVKSPLEPVGSDTWQLSPTTAAPIQLFNFAPPSVSPSSPASPGNSAQRQRMQRLPNNQDDWIFMTPEEILGVSKTKSKMETPLRGAFGGDDNLTPVERYLQRRSQQRSGLTNGWNNDRPEQPWNLSRGPDSANWADFSHQNASETARSLHQIFTGVREANSQEQKGSVSGSGMFRQPSPLALTSPDPDQIASMERFRQLLNSSPASRVPTAPNNQFVTGFKPLVDPFLTQPNFIPNPAGASFTPLSSGISRPTGLTPLPLAVTGVASPIAPVRQVQPAPWLLQGPQPFVMTKPKGF